MNMWESGKDGERTAQPMLMDGPVFVVSRQIRGLPVWAPAEPDIHHPCFVC
jgi:hypothetical protein